METADRKPGVIRSIADVGAMAGLAAMTILVFASVVLRYCFAISFRWSDELTRYLFIYIVFLGIPIAYRHGDHVVIEIATRYLPERIRRRLTVPTHVIIGVLMLVLGIAGLWITFGKMGTALTPGLQIPRAVMHAALPIGVFFLLIEITIKLREAFRGNGGAA
jgi:TRAP-type C4-dicarboxylate transport system permease small subunit